MRIEENILFLLIMCSVRRPVKTLHPLSFRVAMVFRISRSLTCRRLYSWTVNSRSNALIFCEVILPHILEATVKK